MILYLLATPILFVAAPQGAPVISEESDIAVVSAAPVPELASETEPVAQAPEATNATSPTSLAPAASDPEPEQPSGDDIVVTAHKRSAGDPLEKVNLKSFAVTQSIDDNVTAPLARAYEHGLPRPLRHGLHNFLSNLHEPVVFINFMLQHKVGKAAETLARFAIDSTAGAGGVIDVAKRRPFNLPRRRNSFADTLGFYGVKPGPFMFLPLMGPTTVRDLAGGLLDRLVLPGIPNSPFAGPSWAVPAGVVHTLDQRVDFDDELARERATDDPYTARRDYYLRSRQAEIDALHGKGAASKQMHPASLAAPS